MRALVLKILVCLDANEVILHYSLSNLLYSVLLDACVLLYCLFSFCMVKKQQLEPDMEQTGSKSGKEHIKAVYCHPAYLTYMQSASG